MAARAVWLLLAIPAVPLLCLQLRSAGFNPGWKDVLLLGGRGLLFLAVLALILLMTTPWLTSPAPSNTCLTVTEEENKRRQKRVREEQQETLSNQSSAYLKRVLKPRQEMKLRKREERFYQMTGETWKSLAGHKLRGHEEPRLANEYRAPRDIPNREASKRRRLPEPLSPVSASPVQSRAKKVLVLPEEPPEVAEEVVSVALRCPDGRVLRRRFYKTCSSQLARWLTRGIHRQRTLGSSRQSVWQSSPGIPLGLVVVDSDNKYLGLQRKSFC
ncbi:UBX domain-containing protein 8 isoform X2 [Notamacropus eugenii]|uniref:UBX domain-containing protein 8 isoform X2 n=1 Tax=Notamacropus eugenii TaxID=9315 RepID=UPI003B66DDEF